MPVGNELSELEQDELKALINYVEKNKKFIPNISQDQVIKAYFSIETDQRAKLRDRGTLHGRSGDKALFYFFTSLFRCYGVINKRHIDSKVHAKEIQDHLIRTQKEAIKHLDKGITSLRQGLSLNALMPHVTPKQNNDLLELLAQLEDSVEELRKCKPEVKNDVDTFVVSVARSYIWEFGAPLPRPKSTYGKCHWLVNVLNVFADSTLSYQQLYERNKKRGSKLGDGFITP